MSASTMLKIAALAPIPAAKARMAVSGEAGGLAKSAEGDAEVIGQRHEVA